MHTLNLTDNILKWYDTNRRDLPWRKTHDPYKIWVSEVILQQTRINQGTGYYLRFIKAFPDISSLAGAPIDRILKIWQGLGYYSRARNMHAAAQHLYKYKGGVMPETYEGLLEMKGVGEYTAAAIASIAYNLAIPLVDGNVYRVLSRYFGIKTPIDSNPARKEFLEKAAEVLNQHRPGDHNQALMELGALICLPSGPKCNECPIQKKCYALKHNAIDQLPVKARKTSVSKRFFYYLVIRTDDFLIMNKRKKSDIWKGLYDFPLVETAMPSSLLQLKKSREWKDILKNEKYSIVNKKIKLVHKLSHQIIFAEFIEIKTKAKIQNMQPQMKYVRIDKIKNLAVSKMIDNYMMHSNYDF